VTRALDSPEVIEQRLRNARREMTARREFQYRIVNDRLNDAYECLRAILKAERCRRR
jgi:guanylate kinase